MTGGLAASYRYVVLGGLVVAVLLAGHLLPIGQHSMLLQQLRNAMHAPVFLVLTLVLFRLASGSMSQHSAALLAGASAFLAALGGEGLQALTGSHFSSEDVLRDLAGAACALSFLLARRAVPRSGPASAWQRRLLLAVAGVLMLVVAWPLAWSSFVLGARAAAVPVVASFDADWELAMVVSPPGRAKAVPTPVDWPVGGKRVLQVAPPAARYGGVQIVDPWHDWRDFGFLSFVAASASGQPLELTLRVHDEAHNNTYSDRYNHSWTISSEPRRICIPLALLASAPQNRVMDLGTIAGMTFFLTDTTGAEAFLLDEIRLFGAGDGACTGASTVP